MTATTVGYGEYTAVTAPGRIMAVLVTYLGIIGIALPSTIIGKCTVPPDRWSQGTTPKSPRTR